MSGWLVDPGLSRAGFQHGFGTRAALAPEGVMRPRQVHGARVVRVGAREDLGEADAVVGDVAGTKVAVVTADCVPILLGDARSGAVAAVHAGWRGLVAGVVEAAVGELVRDARSAELHAAIGPCICACCYEVDAPVLEPLRKAFGEAVAAATRPTRPGHGDLDLAALVAVALTRAGVPEAGTSTLRDVCTRCDAERFHSHRRDGERAGRLVHWIEARAPS